MVEGFIVRVLITGGQENEMKYALMEELKNKKIHYITAEHQRENSVCSSLGNSDVYTFSTSRELAELLMMQQINCVIHLSNKTITSNSMKDSFDQSEENIACTVEVLEACVQAKVNKIIFPSSIAVYGDITGNIKEEMTLQPVLFEGLSKKIEEKYIQTYHTLYNLSYTILRFPIVYGQPSIHNQNEGMMEATIKKVLENRPPIIFDDDGQKKHLLYISDAIEAIISSIYKGENEIFNICPEEKFSMKEVVAIIQSAIKDDTFYAMEEGEKNRISTRKAQLQLGWHCKVSVAQGIRFVIEDIKHNEGQTNQTLK